MVSNGLHKASPYAKLAIGLSFAAGLLATVEIVLRLAGFKHQASRQIIVWNDKQDREMETGRGMQRFHPYWFWELRPGANVDGCGYERINRAGYRGRERPLSSSPGTLRIVTLGDSTTFGMGVCANETYSAVLESEFPGSEVLNFGVIGYTAFQGEKLLAGRVLDYQPRVVLAAFGAVNELLPAHSHDVDAKFEITSRINPLVAIWRDRLRHLRMLEMLERLAVRPSQNAILVQGQLNYMRWQRGQRDYVRNQSVSSFERSLRTIVNLAKSRGALVVLIAPPRHKDADVRWPWAEDYSAAIGRVAFQLGVPCWDVRAAMRAVPNSDTSLLLDYMHPNAAGHLLMGKFLAGKVKRLLSSEESMDACEQLTQTIDGKRQTLTTEADQTYDFLNKIGYAAITSSVEDYVKIERLFTSNNERREVLFQHPNSEVVFKEVSVGKNATLQFGIGINQAAWDKPGDGVLFEVIVVDKKSRKISVFSKYIDPKKNAGDRKWFDYSLDLQTFAGQEVSFVFKTSGGPEENVEYDWAGWSNPQVMLKKDIG